MMWGSWSVVLQECCFTFTYALLVNLQIKLILQSQTYNKSPVLAPPKGSNPDKHFPTLQLISLGNGVHDVTMHCDFCEQDRNIVAIKCEYVKIMVSVSYLCPAKLSIVCSVLLLGTGRGSKNIAVIPYVHPTQSTLDPVDTEQGHTENKGGSLLSLKSQWRSKRAPVNTQLMCSKVHSSVGKPHIRSACFKESLYF